MFILELHERYHRRLCLLMTSLPCVRVLRRILCATLWIGVGDIHWLCMMLAVTLVLYAILLLPLVYTELYVYNLLLNMSVYAHCTNMVSWSTGFPILARYAIHMFVLSAVSGSWMSRWVWSITYSDMYTVLLTVPASAWMFYLCIHNYCMRVTVCWYQCDGFSRSWPRMIAARTGREPLIIELASKPWDKYLYQLPTWACSLVLRLSTSSRLWCLEPSSTHLKIMFILELHEEYYRRMCLLVTSLPRVRVLRYTHTPYITFSSFEYSMFARNIHGNHMYSTHCNC